MPVNKNAYLRYRIIDQCLKNDRHRYPDKEYILERLDEVLSSVSSFTFDKDIKAMKDLFGAPIAFNRQHRGYYYNDEHFSLNQFPLAEEEISALDFSTAVLQSLKHTPLFDQFEAAVDKVINGYKVGRILGKSDEEIIQVETPLSAGGVEWLLKIYRAILEKEALSMLYQPF
jgi:predicted DNA-binding transcriptional regulator YafY